MLTLATLIAPAGDHSSGLWILPCVTLIAITRPRVGRDSVSPFCACNCRFYIYYIYICTGRLCISLLPWPRVRRQQWEERGAMTNIRHDRHLIWEWRFPHWLEGRSFTCWHSQWSYCGTRPHPFPGLHPSWSEPSFCGTVSAGASVAGTKGQHAPTFRASYLEVPSTEIKCNKSDKKENCWLEETYQQITKCRPYLYQETNWNIHIYKRNGEIWILTRYLCIKNF